MGFLIMLRDAEKQSVTECAGYAVQVGLVHKWDKLSQSSLLVLVGTNERISDLESWTFRANWITSGAAPRLGTSGQGNQWNGGTAGMIESAPESRQ